MVLLLIGKKIMYKLSNIQITICLTDHFIIGLLMTIQIPDQSGIQIPTEHDVYLHLLINVKLFVYTRNSPVFVWSLYFLVALIRVAHARLLRCQLPRPGNTATPRSTWLASTSSTKRSTRISAPQPTTWTYQTFFVAISRYSHDPKTGHSNTGNIRIPDILKV